MKLRVALVIASLLLGGCNPQTTVAPGGIKVVNMSPRETKAGVPFNVQADQGSGISFELSRPAPPGTISVTFNGKPLGGVAAGGSLVTATIPASYLAKPGVYPVLLRVPDSKTAVVAGFFTVQ